MYPEEGQRWVRGSQVRPVQAAEGVLRKTLAYGGGLMCVENHFEAGAVGALHSHPHTQITYVVCGRFAFEIDGERQEVGPGDTMLKQNGVPHGCRCLEKGILLDIFTPIREDFL